MPAGRDLLLSLFRFDLESGKVYWINPPKYHPRMIGREAGHARKSHAGKRYVVIKVGKKAYKRGRMIFFIANGFWPDPCIDHINGDSLDDRLCNLRQATVTQNALNHKGRKKSSKLPMGVRVIASSGRFQARIAHHKRMIHIGAFDTAEQAATAYQEKRRELYGAFA